MHGEEPRRRTTDAIVDRSEQGVLVMIRQEAFPLGCLIQATLQSTRRIVVSDSGLAALDT